MPTPILETERLRLRPIHRSDAPRIQELFPHYELLKYMAVAIPWPYPDDGAETFLNGVLADNERGERYTWAMTLKDPGDDQLVGIIELFPTNPNDHRGFWLGLPYHRQGYTTEAVAAINDFAFDVLNLDRMLPNNAEPNVASHRLKEKSGASILEITDNVPFIGDTFRQIRWTLTREQWHRNRQRFLQRNEPQGQSQDSRNKGAMPPNVVVISSAKADGQLFRAHDFSRGEQARMDFYWG